MNCRNGCKSLYQKPYYFSFLQFNKKPDKDLYYFSDWLKYLGIISMYSKSTLKIQNPDAIIRRFPRPLKQESGYFPPTLFQSLKKQLKHCFTLFDRGVGRGGGVGLGVENLAMHLHSPSPPPPPPQPLFWRTFIRPLELF